MPRIVTAGPQPGAEVKKKERGKRDTVFPPFSHSIAHASGLKEDPSQRKKREGERTRDSSILAGPPRRGEEREGGGKEEESLARCLFPQLHLDCRKKRKCGRLSQATRQEEKEKGKGGGKGPYPQRTSRRPPRQLLEGKERRGVEALLVARLKQRGKTLFLFPETGC